MRLRSPGRLLRGVVVLTYAVDIFVNGRKVFQGDATYISRDIQFLGTVSMRGAMAPRLKKGANQVGVNVKENRRESQGELRRLGRRVRAGRSGRAQRAGAGGGGALTGDDFDPGRASAYISHAMAVYRPERSSPTV